MKKRSLSDWREFLMLIVWIFVIGETLYICGSSLKVGYERRQIMRGARMVSPPPELITDSSKHTVK